VDHDRAGTAAALAAAVLAAAQVQVFPQDVEQAPGGVGVDAVFRPVDLEFGGWHGVPLKERPVRAAVVSSASSKGSRPAHVDNKPLCRAADSCPGSAAGSPGTPWY